MACYFGFSSVGNKIAWVIFILFFTAGSVLLVIGAINTNSCIEDGYQKCFDDTGDKQHCAEVADDICQLRKWIIILVSGIAVFIVCLFPLCFFCCCATNPGHQVQPDNNGEYNKMEPQGNIMMAQPATSTVVVVVPGGGPPPAYGQPYEGQPYNGQPYNGQPYGATNNNGVPRAIVVNQ